MPNLRHATFARYEGHTVIILDYTPATCRVRWQYPHDKIHFDVATASLTEFCPAPALTREQETAAFFAEFRLYEHDAQRRIASGRTI